MFNSFRNTLDIIKTSWHVLQQDKELTVFPFLSLVSAAIFASIAGVVISISGGITNLNAGTIIVYFVAYVVFFFVVNFFNAALIAGALERLHGGDPTIRSSLAKVTKKSHLILGWAIISASVNLIIQSLQSLTRQRGGIGGVLAALGLYALLSLWNIMTFLVVPVIVAEGLGPISAIKRSFSLLKSTWGNQLIASFGFGILYIIAALPGVLLGFLFSLLTPAAGILIGLIVGAIGIGIVQTLASIFKAALYNYAVGGSIASAYSDGGAKETFQRDTLRNAYKYDPGYSRSRI